MPPKQKQKECALVRWLIDETVGVMPLSAIRPGQQSFVGAVIDMKYQSKFFEAEILKISRKCFSSLQTAVVAHHLLDNRQLLNSKCDALANLEITREDLLQQDAKQVDSTTDIESSPAKKPCKSSKIPATKGKKGKEKSKKLARVAAAQARAKSMFFHDKSVTVMVMVPLTYYCKS